MIREKGRGGYGGAVLVTKLTPTQKERIPMTNTLFKKEITP
jgi:hypothetical protein